MRGLKSRLDDLESRIKAKTANKTTPCICPHGERRFYFVIEGKTEAEAAAIYPNNRKYCPRCGGQNLPIDVDPLDMEI